MSDKTIFYQSQGSLSLVMLLIQMPGSLVVVFYQAILNNGSIFNSCFCFDSLIV
jgi:hypothetical protein